MFLAEHQRREANSRGTLEQRLDQLRHEFRGAMADNEVSLSPDCTNIPGARKSTRATSQYVIYNHIINECGRYQNQVRSS